MACAERTPPPSERRSVTHHLEVTDREKRWDFYVQVGFYPSGAVCEVFITTEGSADPLLGRMLEQWAITVSISLQHGVPLAALLEKLAWSCFDPSGATNVPALPRCTSALDFISRFLRLRHCPATEAASG